MNVLETLKVKDATILNIKDGDILFIKLNQDATLSEISNVREGFESIIRRRELDVDLVVGNSISDFRIIRR